LVQITCVSIAPRRCDGIMDWGQCGALPVSS
jgi:hypothetical protein